MSKNQLEMQNQETETYNPQTEILVKARLDDINSLISVIQGVMSGHSNKLSQFYNECDKAQCGFCCAASKDIDRIIRNLIIDN